MAAILAVLFVAVVIALDWLSGDATSVVGSSDPEPSGPRPTRRGAAVR